MMKKRYYLLPALLAAAVLAAPVHAQSRLDKFKSTGEIAIGHRDASIPFSYLDDNQKPLGYSLDICYKIVENVQKALNLPKLTIKLVPVTSSTRIPLVANGTVDINCGSSTNTLERQVQVDFAPTTFVTATRFLAKKDAGIKVLDDLKGKTVISTAGTSNILWLTQANEAQKLGLRIIPAKDHAEAFLTVANGRAAAFFMDDILLAGLVANAHNPGDWLISADAYTIEPYALMLPKNDPDFKKIVSDTITGMMKDGSLATLYTKWFESPIPPKNVNLQLPMSEPLKRAIANPTDSADPDKYR